jgi:hypothetical protein
MIPPIPILLPFDTAIIPIANAPAPAKRTTHCIMPPYGTNRKTVPKMQEIRPTVSAPSHIDYQLQIFYKDTVKALDESAI